MSTFTGTQRFDIATRLGAGGFGTVYKAFDRDGQETVALKLLHRRDAEALRRFKSEFRTLADVSHPNLVSLFELHHHGADWFFTMEYVEGVTFRDWVAPGLRDLGGPADAPRSPHADAAAERSVVLTRPARPAALAQAAPIAGQGDAGWRATTQVAPAGTYDGRAVASDFADVPTFDPGPSGAGATPASGLVGEASSAISTPSSEPRVAPVSFHGIAAPSDDARAGWTATLPTPGGRPSPAAEADRLRDAFRQLAEGLTWLHGAGKLHRDVKPSNVLVDAHGRVVVLDFGLVTRLAVVDPNVRDPLIGTPLYMAPELCAGLPATPASDWYSLGVMLYLALTGELPFRGEQTAVLLAKQALDPRRPAEVAAGVPPDLDDLAMRLLTRNPRMRPTADAILYALGWKPSVARPTAPRPHPTGPFVGRDAEVQAIRDGLAHTRAGAPVVRLVSGPSGMGKSALCEHALAPLSGEGGPLILRSRCYERGSVPYRALDGAIDDVSRLLSSMDPAQARRILPRDTDALARLFPVLSAARDEGVPRLADDRDAQTLKRRAYAALRELFVNLAASRTVVLYIDDLQWGDEDSLAPLAELLRAPGAPPILLLGAFRGDERDRSAFLTRLLAPGGVLRDVQDQRVIALGPLTAEDARALATQLSADEATVDAVVGDAGGSPFLIGELVRHLGREERTRDDDGAAPPEAVVTGRVGQEALDELLLERARSLPDDARRYVEVLAVAGEPVPARLLREVAPLDTRAFQRLEQDHLVRAVPGAHGEGVAPYHDRVRESVVGALDDATRRAHHAALAEAGRETGLGDDEFLAEHFLGGGRTPEAHHHALRAASRAETALAFDRSAHFYRMALALGEPTAALTERLADALRNAGRGSEAAREYLAAAERMEGDAGRALGIKAVEQLLFAGAFAEGEAVIRRVLGSVGVAVARSTAASLGSMMWHTARMKVRGLDFTARPEREPDNDALVDLLWSATIGMSMASPLASTALQQRHLRHALNTGDPYRAMRAMSIELAFSALPGGKDERKSEELSRRAHAVAAQVDHPYGEAFVTMSDGAVHWLRGRWLAAREACETATAVYDADCTGVTWEKDTAQFVILSTYAHVGDLAGLRARLVGLLADALERGDLYAETQLRTRFAWMLALAEGDAERARADLERAIAAWTASGFQIVDFWTLIGHVTAWLYDGEPAQARAVIEAARKPLKRSFMLMGQYYRVHFLELDGRCAVAEALAADAGSGERVRALKKAEKAGTRLVSEGMPWAEPAGRRLQGLVAAARGDAARAATLLAEAAAGFDRADMALDAAAARWARAIVDGGATDPGRDAALAWAEAQGVAQPDRFLRAWAPLPG